MKSSIILSLSFGVLFSGCAHSHYQSRGLAANSATSEPATSMAAPAPSISSTATVGATPPVTATATNPPPAVVASEPSEPAPTAFSPSPSAGISAPRQSVEATASAEPTAGPSSPTASVPAAMAYVNSATVSAERLRNWKLLGDDVRQELQSSGQIVRVRELNAGEPIDPAVSRVNELIMTKLNNNQETAGLQLQVSIDNGTATLSGTAHTNEQIGEAVAITLDTPGVLKVVSTVRTDTTR